MVKVYSRVNSLCIHFVHWFRQKGQRALLLPYTGEDMNGIFYILTDTGEDFATAKLKLTECFIPLPT
jgi:hypothetical protein